MRNLLFHPVAVFRAVGKGIQVGVAAFFGGHGVGAHVDIDRFDLPLRRQITFRILLRHHAHLKLGARIPDAHRAAVDEIHVNFVLLDNFQKLAAVELDFGQAAGPLEGQGGVGRKPSDDCQQ